MWDKKGNEAKGKSEEIGLDTILLKVALLAPSSPVQRKKGVAN